MDQLYKLTLESLRANPAILPAHSNNQREIWAQKEGIKLIDFSASADTDFEYMDCLDSIEQYFQKAKFIFHRDQKLYKEYIIQIKYYICHIAHPSLRQDLLTGLVREQALRQGQYTLNDSELVQLVLDVVYCPTYNPVVISLAKGQDDDEGEPERVISLLGGPHEDIKFMEFNQDTVEFILHNIMPYISNEGEEAKEFLGFERSDEALDTSDNQKIFIT